MPVNDRLYDRLVHSRTGLIKYEHRTVRRIRSTFNDVQRELISYLSGLPEAALPRYGNQQKLLMAQKLNEYMGNGQLKGMQEVRDAMLTAANRENREMIAALRETLPNELPAFGVSFYEVPDTLIAAILDQEILGDYTQTLRGYSGKFTADTRAAIDRALGAAAVQGESIPQISARLRMITGMQGQALATFSRTAIQTAAFRAQRELYKANRDVIKREKYTATFDARVCPICAGYDARTYPVGGGPAIPIHAGCRCTYTPVTKSFRELGVPIDEMPPGEKWTMDGKVPETMPLEKWLRKAAQDPAHEKRLRQNWGANRLKLFRQGKVNLDDLAVRHRGRERVLGMRALRRKARRKAS